MLHVIVKLNLILCVYAEKSRDSILSPRGQNTKWVNKALIYGWQRLCLLYGDINWNANTKNAFSPMYVIMQWFNILLSIMLTEHHSQWASCSVTWNMANHFSKYHKNRAVGTQYIYNITHWILLLFGLNYKVNIHKSLKKFWHTMHA